MPDRKVWFGAGLGAWNGADVASVSESARLAAQADTDGLDLFTGRHRPRRRRLGSVAIAAALKVNSPA